MRLVTFILIGLLVLIQIPMWWGHGGWLRVHDMQQQLDAQLQKNADEKARNDHIAGEVQDLTDGTSAVEERARYEMGMMKDGEVFVQFVSPNGTVAAPSGVQPALMARSASASAPVNVVPNPVSEVIEHKKRHLAHLAAVAAATQPH